MPLIPTPKTLPLVMILQQLVETTYTNGGFTSLDTQFVRVPVGTTAQRPFGANGYLRFNTNSGVLEQWNANTSFHLH